jgi:hypothetical protein
MALATYTDQSPSEIRNGDRVQDSNGTYTAHSDAERDQWGEIMVIDDGNRYRSYSKGQTVTITFEETSDMYT